MGEYPLSDLVLVRNLLAKGLKEAGISTKLGITRHAARKLVAEATQQPEFASIMEIEPQTADEFAERIARCWRKSLDAIFEVGRLLIMAKERLPHGEFEAMVESNLPFGPRHARRLMAIAEDPKLSNRTHVSVLPPTVGTLYELTKLDEEAFTARVADKTIRPDMERRDIAGAIKAERRQARESHLGEMQAAANLRLPSARYGVILADPEWRFEPWSRETGLDRSPANHYPTSALEVIKARPVEQIAAKDCALFLWATVPMLPQALLVMGAWGFDYKTHWIWLKNSAGTGYWNRNKHELLLLGTRGDIPAPAMGEQWLSVLEGPISEHSVKPDIAMDMIEAYFPTVPKIELNARRTRPGWANWGLDAPANQEAAE